MRASYSLDHIFPLLLSIAAVWETLLLPAVAFSSPDPAAAFRTSLIPSVALSETAFESRRVSSTIKRARRTALLASVSVDENSVQANPSKNDSNATDSSSISPEIDWDWEKVATDVFQGDDQRPIILFDGVCNLCNGGVNFAMDQDEEAKFRFCSLQSKVAQSLLLQAGQAHDERNKICLFVDSDQAYFSSEAVARICSQLDAAPLRWFGTIGRYTPEWIRERIYQFVSENRYQFGENDSCRLDFDGTYTSRFVSDPTELSDNSAIK